MRCQSKKGAGLCCWQWWMSGAPTLSSGPPPSLSVSSTAVQLHRGWQIQRDSNKNPIFPTRGGRGESRRRSISSAGGGGRQCFIEHTQQRSTTHYLKRKWQSRKSHLRAVSQQPSSQAQHHPLEWGTTGISKNTSIRKWCFFHRNLMNIFNFFSSGFQAVYLMSM